MIKQANIVLYKFKYKYHTTSNQPKITHKNKMQSQLKQDQSQHLLRTDSRTNKASGSRSEQLGDSILMYATNAFWVGLAIAAVYYSNFFHHLFNNPKINQVFFQISMTGYTMIVMLIIYSSFVLPYWFKVKSIEEYNPKLIPIGAVVGVISVISLLIAIWPVWGFTSIPLFISMWKGFFSLSTFLPSGIIGDILFILLNAGSVLSFYLIEHQGYFH